MNSVFLFVASNLFVACIHASIAYAFGRSGRYAAVAHFLWLCFFIKLITPPIIEAPISIPQAWGKPLESVYQVVNTVESESANLVVKPAHGQVTVISEPQLENSHAKSWHWLTFLQRMSVMDWILIAWLTGTCLIIIRGVIRFARFSWLLQRESDIDYEATELVQQMLGNVRFSPTMRRISARVSPMLFGIGRCTCIVCPDSLWQSLNVSEQQAFLAHEIAHFRRRDHWVRWLEWLVTAIYWWLPLVYVARKQLERHEEAACDAWAIANLNTPPRAYAEALLSVVDFLSETKVGMPRLASRMQATDSLEERLRLIMATHRPKLSPVAVRGLTIACVTLLIIHPIPYYSSQATAALSHDTSFDSSSQLADPADKPPNEADSHRNSWSTLLPLPPEPRGWWNEALVRGYADVKFEEHHLRMLVEAGGGIEIQSQSTSHSFEAESVRALAFVPAKSRLIIGNANGELHLWDVNASQPVSLIGKHQSAVSSLAYHPRSGLVSGDQDGNLIRWDIQSGQMLELASTTRRIAAVRWSQSGDQLAVVTGDWSESSHEAQLIILNGRSLERVQQVVLRDTIAVVDFDPERGWLAIDWSGEVWSLTNGQLVGKLPKADVSGIALCQDLFSTSKQNMRLNQPAENTFIPME